MKFKYKSYRVVPTATVPDGIVRRPEVALRIIGPSRSRRVLALLDSGADETILPLVVAKRLDIPLHIDKSSRAMGVTGHPLRLIPGEVELEIASSNELFRWKAMVSFADFSGPDSECAVLGHLGALQFFSVAFDGLIRTVSIDPNSSFVSSRS